MVTVTCTSQSESILEEQQFCLLKCQLLNISGHWAALSGSDTAGPGLQPFGLDPLGPWARDGSPCPASLRGNQALPGPAQALARAQRMAW